MRILIQDRNKQMSAVEVPNFEYLPLFYCFPKELLRHGAKYLIDLPRNPARILKDMKWLGAVTDDAFLSVLMDGAAFLVWPAFEVKANLESFSGNDPLWKLSRAIGLWTEALNQQMQPKLMQTLIQNPSIEMPWMSIEAATQLFPSIAYRAIDKHNLRPIIDTIKSMRCIEDFDDRSSRAKTDFYRKWNHSRTKHPTISLDALLDAKIHTDYADIYANRANVLDKLLYPYNANSDSVDYIDDCICKQLDTERFIESLSEKDKTILDLRLKGLTQVEIAKQLGYSTHSAVTKRLDTIGKQYRAFMDGE